MQGTKTQNWISQSLGGIVGVIVFVFIIGSEPPSVKTTSETTESLVKAAPAEKTIEQNIEEARIDTSQQSNINNSELLPPYPSTAYKLITTETSGFGPTLPEPQTLQLTLGRGDALIDRVVATGISASQAYRAIEALGQNIELRKLQIGQEIELVIDTPLYEGESLKLWSLAVRSEFDTMVRATSQSDGSFTSKEDEIPTLLMTMFNTGEINDSLFLAAERAGVPAEIIISLIRTYSFEVDFQREIRPGDHFEVYYQRRLTKDGLEVENGDIQYARLVLRGKPLPYYRFTPSDDGRTDFFSNEGESATRALMKTPLDVAVMTSNYGSRRHPVLGYTRMHTGVDFRAPTGTPIMAAGDGIIERSSRYGTYGNYIRIKHNGTYSTAYAHLSRYGRGVRQGARVSQGQIIGYSGATGRVTAAHLHYEVLINGEQTNPMRLNLPTGRKLGGDELELFMSQQKAIDIELEALRSLEAMNEDDAIFNASMVEPAS